MKRLVRAKVPGIELISDEEDMQIIGKQFPELLDENKWVRFPMSGEDQGEYGRFGQWKENKANKIHNCLVEIYSFQSAKSTNSRLSYCNVLVLHELDDNNTPTGKNMCLKGGSINPFRAHQMLAERLDIENPFHYPVGKTSITFT